MTYVRIVFGLFACAFVALCEQPGPVPPQPTPSPGPSGFELPLPVETEKPPEDSGVSQLNTTKV